MIWLILILWVICGYYSYGYCFGYFQREFPTLAERDYEKDRRRALFYCLSGPLSLAVDFMMGQTKHGRKYK